MLTESIEYTALTKTLKSYISLEEDWDGYGGIAPDETIVSTAITLLGELKNSITMLLEKLNIKFKRIRNCK